LSTILLKRLLTSIFECTVDRHVNNAVDSSLSEIYRQRFTETQGFQKYGSLLTAELDCRQLILYVSTLTVNSPIELSIAVALNNYFVKQCT